MKCPICGADNGHAAQTCLSCGSNLNTRGGADIVMRNDGTADHAGDSRWKSGAGVAGAGALAGLAKFGAFGLLFKAWVAFRLISLATVGGISTVIAIVAAIAFAAAVIFRHRMRLRI